MKSEKEGQCPVESHKDLKIDMKELLAVTKPMARSDLALRLFGGQNSLKGTL